MIERQFVQLEVRPGAATETQSGLARLRPRINGAYERPANGKGKGAFLLMHPTSDFGNHPLMSPLAERGYCVMGLNSRYQNNDCTLLAERVIQDLGTGVKFLREQGHDKVVLLGFSGGAAVSAFYQSQATELTVTHTPAGDPIDLVQSDFPAAEAVLLCAAHPGRSRIFVDWLDPSVTDERDGQSVDPALDMFDPRNGPPYSPEFVSRYTKAQVERRDRIERWVRARLDHVRSKAGTNARDEAFIVHRTYADLRFVDLNLDRNDREAGGILGDARAFNYASNSIGRYTSLTSFLSQWAGCSHADGPANLAKTKCPVRFVDLTADGSCFPSTLKLWMDGIGSRGSIRQIRGADHFLRQKQHLEETADDIAAWAESL